MTTIDIADVSKHYVVGAEQRVALGRVDLEIGEYEFVSLLGPSGCGKSTLLRLISGLEEPSTGSVRLRSGSAEVDAATAFCFQHDALLEWRRVVDNVLLPIELESKVTAADRDLALHYLDRVGLGGFAEHYPHQLSGGMRQRAALCRALIADKPVLLMDEPFGALDAITREFHQGLLQEIWLNERKTIVFVTHDIREAVYLSDRIVVMKGRPGQIAADITVDLPRPRTREMEHADEYQDLLQQIRSIMEVTSNG